MADTCGEVNLHDAEASLTIPIKDVDEENVLKVVRLVIGLYCAIAVEEPTKESYTNTDPRSLRSFFRGHG